MAPSADADHPDGWTPGLRLRFKVLNVKTVTRATGPGEVLPVCLSHNLRSGNDDHRHRSRIDPTRTHANEVLRGPACPMVAGELVRTTLDELGIVPPRRDAIMGIEAVVQAPDGADVPAFWSVCLSWFDCRYQHIISAVVHRDQLRPHLHIIALAVAGGRLAGHALTSGVNRVMSQRRDFLAHVFAALGLRPNRTSDPLTALALSTGKGAKTAAAAAARDDKLTRKANANWRRNEACMAVAAADVHGGLSVETGNRHAQGKDRPPLLRVRRPAPKVADFWGHRRPPAVLTPTLQGRGFQGEAA